MISRFGRLLNIKKMGTHPLLSSITVVMGKKVRFSPYIHTYIYIYQLSPIPKLILFVFPSVGYPGHVSLTATYILTSSTTMRLDMEAVPENKPTPINLAQHTYWNLAGHDSGDILDHSIQIWANHVTPVDENTIPTGEIMPVKGTPFDFTAEKRIGNDIKEVGMGYDHNYVLDCGEEKLGLKHAAKVRDPSSSRVLNLWTTAPGMQFYTANYVNGITGKGGAVYNKHAGLCLETQGFPNAINQPNFPSIVVQPGEKYKHSMLFEFSVE